jgi:hypothetical protein
MGFQNWIKDGGLWLGLALRFSKLGKNEKFLNSLNFAAWCSICRRRLTAGNDVRLMARYRMRDMAGDNFNHWWSIYNATPSWDSLEDLALEKIQETAKSFYDYWRIYTLLNQPWAKGFALTGIRGLSQSIDAWYTVYTEHSALPDVQEIAFQKILATKGTFEEWVYVREDIWHESPLYAIALHKMFDLAKTADQWHCVFNNSSGELERLAYQKIRELTQEQSTV